MIGLLLAGQVAAAAASLPPIAEPTPNLYVQPAHCPSVVEQELRRQQVALRGPRPIAQYAVLRRLEGCNVPTPLGYHPGYVLPGAADPTPRRADAPRDRR